MTDKTPKALKEPSPSPINGPAFFVFGILFLLLGLGTDMKILVWPGLAFLLVAWLGFTLQRRYEKATGFVETLPGKSPERPVAPAPPEPTEQPVSPADSSESDQ